MEGVKGQDVKIDVLKEARKALGLTQAELAQKIGSKQPDISNLERGKAIPDWLLKSIALSRLLKSVGYSMDDLILCLPDLDSDSEVKP